MRYVTTGLFVALILVLALPVAAAGGPPPVERGPGVEPNAIGTESVEMGPGIEPNG